MPMLTLELPQGMLDRLSQIAAEKSVQLEVIVRHFLDYAIEQYKTALTDEEIEKLLESYAPTLPRPKIDREAISRMVNKAKDG